MSEIGQPARTTSAHRRRRRWPRRLMKLVLSVVVLIAFAAGVLFWASDWGATLGGRIEGERLERVNASPNFADGRAQNAQPTQMGTENTSRDTKDFVVEWFRGAEARRPPSGVPIVDSAYGGALPCINENIGRVLTSAVPKVQAFIDEDLLWTEDWKDQEDGLFTDHLYMRQITTGMMRRLA